MKNTGFSLVELLVVIAIMAVLAGVAVPTYSHFVDEAHKGKDNDYVAELYRMANLEAAAEGLSVEMVVVAMEDYGGKALKGELILVRFAGQAKDDDPAFQDAENRVIAAIREKTEPYEFQYDKYLDPESNAGIQGVYYRRKPSGSLNDAEAEKYAEYGSYTVRTQDYTIIDPDDDDPSDDPDNGIKLPPILLG